MNASQTLIDLIRGHARARPGGVALMGNGAQCTWAALDAHIRAVARTLQRLGIRKGDPVGILATNCPEWVEAFLGTLRCGAVAVPLNHRLTPGERTSLLEDAGVVALLVGPELSETVSFRGPTVLLGRRAATDLSAAPEPEPDAAPQPDDLAVIAYTSGTTGLPKGVMWSHRTLLASAQANPFPAELARGARVLLCPPLGAGGAVVMACNALATAATLVIAHFTPDGVLRSVVDDRIELAGLVPAMIALLVDAAPPAWRAPALRRIYYGAGTLSPRLFARAQQLFGCEFQQGYGMTETCICGTRLDPADHTLAAADRLASAGKPMPGVEVKVVDEDGREVPPGTAGEILIKSPGNMLGYWRRDEETRRALSDGWHRTRDIGWYDGDHYLHLLDRKDDMVKSGGLNVSPAEVEGVLVTHPAVAEAAVIGLPDERWGERVTAIVRPRAGVVVHERDLTAFCRSRLAGFKNPRTIVFTEAPLPRNALGKLSRRALRTKYHTLVAE